MAQITKQERVGLEELFVCIEKGRYEKGALFSYKRSVMMIKRLSKLYPRAILRLFKHTK